ncbi:hypothetical protein ONJ17_26095, partial [Salmonella enterica subsp. enterica serovar Agona]|nr:hypothetical protein [Salmonella enterica subsp. enterica serovar Agona]
MMDLFKAIGLGLVVLLPLANPLTTVALFLGLAGNMNSAVPEGNQIPLMLTMISVLLKIMCLMKCWGSVFHVLSLKNALNLT